VDRRGVGALRWVAAVAAMVVAVAILVPMSIDAISSMVAFEDQGSPLFDDADDDEPLAPLPDDVDVTGPVEDGHAPPLVDFVAHEGMVQQAADPHVTIGDDDGDLILLAFDLIEGDPVCLEHVELHLSVREATTRVHLLIFPADLPGIEELENGDELPEEILATGHPVAVAVTDGTPGRLVWDLTNVYQSWILGEIDVARLTPFVIAIQPDQPEGALQAQFASSAGEETDPPLLAWRGLPDCP
jgi:hypothetical protein